MFPRLVRGQCERCDQHLLHRGSFLCVRLFSYYHNTTTFPTFSHGVIRQILRKLRKRSTSMFLVLNGINYAIVHFFVLRTHMHILPLINRKENTSSYIYLFSNYSTIIIRIYDCFTIIYSMLNT